MARAKSTQPYGYGDSDRKPSHKAKVSKLIKDKETGKIRTSSQSDTVGVREISDKEFNK